MAKRLPSEVFWPAYDAYLASAAWRRVRAPIVARASGHCEKCGKATKGFQVHHKTYARWGGNERQSDLAAWCVGCHQLHHGVRRPLKPAKPVVVKPKRIKRLNRKGLRKLLWQKCRHCGGTYTWKRHRQICEKYDLVGTKLLPFRKTFERG